MALTPDKLAHFERIGPAEVLLEVTQGRHGQAPDSPLWREAVLWAEAATLRENLGREQRMLEAAELSVSSVKEANRIASEALEASRSSSKWAMYAVVIATVALIVSSKDLISGSLMTMF